MAVFTVTQNEAEALRDFFNRDKYGNIGKDGIHTLGVLDDEDFVMGVLQFSVGYDKERGTFSRIEYLYIQEDFLDSDAADELLWEYRSILAESGVTEGMADSEEEAPLFIYEDTAEKIYKCGNLSSVSTRESHSISFIEDKEFRAMKRTVTEGKYLGPKDSFNEEISSFYKTRAGEGLLLVKRDSEGILDISFAGAQSPYDREKVRGMFSYSVKRVTYLYSPDTIVRITCRDEAFLQFLAEILPEIFPDAEEDQQD